jgi:Ser/Thr protein kinase RdoA (MazF antagonist)/ribosomal protein S18 acetylase RimI-like enzyme
MEALRILTETTPPGWGSWQIVRGKDSVVLHAYVEAFGREPVNQFEMKVRLGAVDDWGGTWNRVQEFSMTDPQKGANWRNGEAFFSTRLQVPPGKYEYEFLLRKFPTGPWIKEKGQTRVHRLLADPGDARFALRQKFVPIRQGQGTTWQARRLSDRLGAGFVNAEPERSSKIFLRALKDIVYYAVENTQQHGRPGAEAFVDAWVEGDSLFVEVVNPSDLPLPAELDGEYAVASPNVPVPKEKRGPGSRRGEAVSRVRSLVEKVYFDEAIASVLVPRARWSWRRAEATGEVVFRLSVPLPEAGKAEVAPSEPFGAEEVDIVPFTPESARRFEADLLAMERGRPGGWRTLSRFLEEKRAATGTPLEGKWEFSFLAVVNGRAVGYLIGVRPNADKPYAREDLTLRGLPVSKGLVVFRAGVLESARGQGVGRRLWSAVAEAAEAAGIDYIYQDARVDNTRARDLYRRMGFVDIAGFNDSSKDIDYMAMVARASDLRSSTGGRAPGIAPQVLGLSGLLFIAEALERYLSWMGGLLWMAPPGATGPPAALIARAVDRAMSTGGYDRLAGLAEDLRAALLNLGKGPAGLRSVLENTLETAALAVAQLGPEVARRSLDAQRVSSLFVTAETALLANDAPAEPSDDDNAWKDAAKQFGLDGPLEILAGGVSPTPPRLSRGPGQSWVLRRLGDNKDNALFEAALKRHLRAKGLPFPEVRPRAGTNGDHLDDYIVESGGSYYTVESHLSQGHKIPRSEAREEHFASLGKVAAQINNALKDFEFRRVRSYRGRPELVRRSIVEGLGALLAEKGDTPAVLFLKARLRRIDDAFRAQKALFERNWTAGGTRSVIHNDLHFGNVRFHPDGSVAGVYDLGLAQEDDRTVEFRSLFLGFESVNDRPRFDLSLAAAVLRSYQQWAERPLSDVEITRVWEVWRSWLIEYVVKGAMDPERAFHALATSPGQARYDDMLRLLEQFPSTVPRDLLSIGKGGGIPDSGVDPRPDASGPEGFSPGRLTVWVLAAVAGLLWLALGPAPGGGELWAQTVGLVGATAGGLSMTVSDQQTPDQVPFGFVAMVNLMDVGSHLRAAKMATDRGLAKAARLLPFLADTGMNDVYIHNGLYEPSAAGVVVHTESTAAPEPAPVRPRDRFRPGLHPQTDDRYGRWPFRRIAR